MKNYYVNENDKEYIQKFNDLFRKKRLEIPFNWYKNETLPNRKGPKMNIRFSRIGLPYAFLTDFIRNLEISYKTLPDVDSDLRDPIVGYCIPNEIWVSQYCSSESIPKGEILNKSHANIERWLKEFIGQIVLNSKDQPYREIRAVNGKVGSGKSTFVSYLDKGHKKFFIERNVIFVVVSYGDFEFGKKKKRLF